MDEHLDRRSALVLLAAMAAALLIGLLAWGPVPLTAASHQYADERVWLGLRNGANVLASLPLLAVALWGWRVTRNSPWPEALRRAWSAFHACAALAAVGGALYHLLPQFVTWLLATTATSAAFAMLGAGALAERVDMRLARPRALAALLGFVLLAALAVVLDETRDLRLLLLIETLPVLLLPAGALTLPGPHTRPADWIVMLLGYGAAKLADLADTWLLRTSGGLSGHTLMHLLLAGVAARLAYCALRSTPHAEPELPSQRVTSLNTAG